MSIPHVYILTFCSRIELLYGATLTFKTLRVGFPNSPIHVADGASIPAARTEIQRAARNCGAEFMQFKRRVELYDFMRQAIELQQSGQAVFVDPDICFWECVEDWNFQCLAAGRFIPRHHCDFSGCLTEPRLHTSFLWFPDVAKIRTVVRQLRQTHVGFEPLRNMRVPVRGTWHFFDNAAGLYSLCPDEMQHFTERQLDAYDHLFSGSFSDSVLKKLADDFAPVYRDIHKNAQRDYRLLRGCWRAQERYFQNRLVD